MSKSRVNITLEVDTLAHATTIANAIDTRLSGKDIFENHGVSAYLDRLSQSNLVSVDLRFNARLDRDDVVDWAKDQVRNHPQIKNWVLSASVTSHLCSHDDEEVKDCKTTEYVEWNRV